LEEGDECLGAAEGFERASDGGGQLAVCFGDEYGGGGGWDRGLVGWEIGRVLRDDGGVGFAVCEGGAKVGDSDAVQARHAERPGLEEMGVMF